jgi:hypothetical protein
MSADIRAPDVMFGAWKSGLSGIALT